MSQSNLSCHVLTVKSVNRSNICLIFLLMLCNYKLRDESVHTKENSLYKKHIKDI